MWMDLSGGSLASGGMSVGDTSGAPVPPPPVPKFERRNRSSITVDKSEPETERATAAKRTKRTFTYDEKCAAKRRNMKCGCCGKLDTEPDPVDPGHRLLWHEFAMNKDTDVLETSGLVCYICARVHNAKFSHMSLKQFKAELSDPKFEETHEIYSRYCTWLIDQLQEDFKNTGSRDGKSNLDWPTPWQIKEQEIHSWEWELPPATYLAYDDYIKDNPAPPSEMVEVGPDDQKLAKTNHSKEWKKVRKIKHQAIRERAMNDTSNDITNACADDQFASLQKSIGTKHPLVGVCSPAASPNKTSTISPRKVETPEKQSEASGAEQVADSNPVAKAKIQPKVKGTAKAQAKAKGTVKRGRPPQDAARPLQKHLGDLLVVKPEHVNYAKFFGSEWKPLSRNFASYLDDLGSMIENEENMEVLDVLQVTQRQATVVKKILIEVALYGVHSEKVGPHLKLDC